MRGGGEGAGARIVVAGAHGGSARETVGEMRYWRPSEMYKYFFSVTPDYWSKITQNLIKIKLTLGLGFEYAKTVTQ